MPSSLFIRLLRILKEHKIKSLIILGVVIGGLFLHWLTKLPEPLFDAPSSVVLKDRDQRLLGAKIANDGQWRFPYDTAIPEKFEKAILTFEDQRFFYHPGVDPIAILRAIKNNLQEGRIVSGGSTISMQVIRLAMDNDERSFWNKFVETLKALKLEWQYSKKEILALYASHAPFGGNVVGLDAASWRYYNRAPDQLSWSEAAALAVLPNSPGLIHPGKNRKQLKAKRDYLLDRLVEEAHIDSLTSGLAKEETVPTQPRPLPQRAPRLLDRIADNNPDGVLRRSTIRLPLQQKVNNIVNRHYKDLKGNEIRNAAVIVADISAGDVLAYKGNTGNPDNFGSQVDVITAKRSTGSVLKPFLFASMLDEGRILPNSLVKDIPTYIGGYQPENYNKGYSGALPARRALARSLNIPAVRMLRQYGVPRFYHKLEEIGITTLNYSPQHYGLSLILGGADGTLWDITGSYASMARYLKQAPRNAQIKAPAFRPLNYDRQQSVRNKQQSSVAKKPLSKAAIYETFKAMLEVKRPENEAGWEQMASSRRIAWKTGTSFGFRDAWAVGLTRRYVVGVWVGNANGEGRPGLVGIKAAAPILFDVFKTLPKQKSWFQKPLQGMEKIAICKKSGYRISRNCKKADTQWVPRKGLRFDQCPYHQKVHLDSTGNYRVTGKCTSPSAMKTKPWFVLPPAVEWYYQANHTGYKPLPSFKQGCEPIGPSNEKTMSFIYPEDDTKLFIPVELDGSQGKAIFKVAHRNDGAKLYWHLDGQFKTVTKKQHHISVNTSPGNHQIKVVDQKGNTLTRHFEVMGKQEG